jgi:hypothetical protein
MGIIDWKRGIWRLFTGAGLSDVGRRNLRSAQLLIGAGKLSKLNRQKEIHKDSFIKWPDSHSDAQDWWHGPSSSSA